MKIKKPNFWDYKKPNFLSYLLLPFTLPIIVNNYFLNNRNKAFRNSKIKNICIGNIYVGGTAKTPLTIKINQILKNLNFKSAIIKKFYNDQIDEQKLLSENTKLYCFRTRKEALDEAIKDKNDIAIFDDGLQDNSINYDLQLVCFNNEAWIGNGFLIPAGPLREKIESISKYDAIFLNGNSEDNTQLKSIIKKYNEKIVIFETYYKPINIKDLDRDLKYLIFSGIGNPNSFKMTLLKNKFNIIKELKFPDHYNYTSNDIEKIKFQAKSLNAKILTTKKDYMRLNNDDEIQYLDIDLIIKEEDKFINFIKSNI
jgi:tetraacyldisaccharide 4'-kinase